MTSVEMAGMHALLAVLLSLHSLPPAQAHTTFIFNEFNGSTDLSLIRSASIRSNAIWLTNQSQHLLGRALYSQPVGLKDGNETLSFSTTFVFSIIPSSNPPSGHGLAFIITPQKSPMGASATEYLGLFNISSNGQPYNHLFAVEFDTIQNEQFQDIDENHVGVDLNDLTSAESKRAGYWLDNQFRELDLHSGHNIQAWIDYDHLQQQLNVTIAQAGSGRPHKPLMSMRNKTVADIFEEEMYVGFSAATGTIVQDHCILAWSFSTNGVAPVLDTSRLPSFISKISNVSRVVVGVTTAVGVLVMLVVVIAAILWWRRMKHMDFIEEWEMEYWPHRFNYKDLRVATNGFQDEQVLGCGGFGRVYKGVLPSNGLEVAVKCILRESTDGLKEFIAEISSLGRLQHRNLVQIKGYCRRGTRLFIVYDYMPNGSLDKMIFGSPKRVLEWSQRYRILMDVAAGLLYLHEGWERRVVHRDIKSSNVLLDSELNGKLGDFGLARLYERDENPHTTRVVGTLGYIAPELVHTGKAAPSADVFSFGVLMLEVACGRRPVDPSLGAAQTVMVDWVRELHGKEKLMDAVDPKLEGEYVQDEMEKVLKLGLICCNPQAETRLGIRQVIQILEGEGFLPDLQFLFSSEMGTPSDTWKLSSFRSL